MRIFAFVLIGVWILGCSMPLSPPSSSTLVVQKEFLSCLPEVRALESAQTDRIRVQTLQSCLQSADIDSVDYYVSSRDDTSRFLFAKLKNSPEQADVSLKWIEGENSVYSETRLRSGQLIRSKNQLRSALAMASQAPPKKSTALTVSCLPVLTLHENQERSLHFKISTACLPPSEISSVAYYVSSQQAVDQAKALPETINPASPLLAKTSLSSLNQEPFDFAFSKCTEYQGELYIEAEVKLKSGEALISQPLPIHFEKPASCPSGGGGSADGGGGGAPPKAL